MLLALGLLAFGARNARAYDITTDNGANVHAISYHDDNQLYNYDPQTGLRFIPQGESPNFTSVFFSVTPGEGDVVTGVVPLEIDYTFWQKTTLHFDNFENTPFNWTGTAVLSLLGLQGQQDFTITDGSSLVTAVEIGASYGIHVQVAPADDAMNNWHPQLIDPARAGSAYVDWQSQLEVTGVRVVPEPTTAAILALGMLGIAFRSRTQAKK